MLQVKNFLHSIVFYSDSSAITYVELESHQWNPCLLNPIRMTVVGLTRFIIAFVQIIPTS